MLDAREVVDLDIAYDDLPEKYYVEEEVSQPVYTKTGSFMLGSTAVLYQKLIEVQFVEPYSV